MTTKLANRPKAPNPGMHGYQPPKGWFSAQITVSPDKRYFVFSGETTNCNAIIDVFRTSNLMLSEPKIIPASAPAAGKAPPMSDAQKKRLITLAKKKKAAQAPPPVEGQPTGPQPADAAAPAKTNKKSAPKPKTHHAGQAGAA